MTVTAVAVSELQCLRNPNPNPNFEPNPKPEPKPNPKLNLMRTDRDSPEGLRATPASHCIAALKLNGKGYSTVPVMVIDTVTVMLQLWLQLVLGLGLGCVGARRG